MGNVVRYRALPVALIIVVLLSGPGRVRAQTVRTPVTGEGTPTCVVALRSYESLQGVPEPYIRLPLPVRQPNEESLGVVARAGATGYAIEEVPAAELTEQDRALMKEHGVARAWRTVAVRVLADTARVSEACRRSAHDWLVDMGAVVVDHVALSGEGVRDCAAEHVAAARICRLRVAPDMAQVRAKLRGGENAWRSDDVMHFAYRLGADVHEPRLVGGIQLPLSRVRGTDVWVLSVYVPSLDRARFSYAVMEPRGGFLTRSKTEGTFRGPAAPAALPRVTSLRGRITAHDVASVHLAATRRVFVYEPPARGGAPLAGVLYMTDGGNLHTYAAVLDTLIVRGDVPRVLLVAATSAEGMPGSASEGRISEYVLDAGPNARFAAHDRFFSEELRQWAERAYDAPAIRTQRAVFGASAGAAYALATGLRHPDLYAHVIAFSPSPVPSTLLPRARGDVGFYLWAGQLEPAFLESARTWHAFVRGGAREAMLRDDVAGHDVAAWSEELTKGLRWAFGQTR